MSEAEKFEIGDVVKLKSGGPDMTIVEIDTPQPTDPPMASCRWFVQGMEQRGIYPCASLERINVTGEGELEHED